MAKEEMSKEVIENVTYNGAEEVEAKMETKIEEQLISFASLACAWDLEKDGSVKVLKGFISGQGRVYYIQYKDLLLSDDFTWDRCQENSTTYETLEIAFDHYAELNSRWPNWMSNQDYWKYVDQLQPNHSKSE